MEKSDEAEDNEEDKNGYQKRLHGKQQMNTSEER